MLPARRRGESCTSSAIEKTALLRSALVRLPRPAAACRGGRFVSSGTTGASSGPFRGGAWSPFSLPTAWRTRIFSRLRDACSEGPARFPRARLPPVRFQRTGPAGTLSMLPVRLHLQCMVCVGYQVPGEWRVDVNLCARKCGQCVGVLVKACHDD